MAFPTIEGEAMRAAAMKVNADSCVIDLFAAEKVCLERDYSIQRRYSSGR
jgi:hypothetical protein